MKMRFSLPMDTGAYNLYIASLIWCIVFLVSVFFFFFHKWLAALKQNSAKLRYHEDNLFFFGQILSKLKMNTKSMTMICLTMTVSIALFLLTPVLVGWASGFLEKRTPYDIVMNSGYSKVSDISNLPQADYHLMDEFLIKNEIEFTDKSTFKTYFLKEADFYDMGRREAVTAVSLQQLYDAGKYKYRFQVLRNMGVEESRVHRLILKQLMLWFGLPVGLAVILAGVFFIYLLFSFSAQIVVYIGVGKLLRQVVVIFSILMILLISYFVSTLVLFERTALNLCCGK